MILTKILLAFQPPGIGLVYRQNDKEIIKHINLDNLNKNTDAIELTNKILENESLHTQSHKKVISNGIVKIQEKLIERTKECQYVLEHFLPVTNISIDSSGKKCVIGCYDHTAKIWNLNTGTQEQTLKGHESVVFSTRFNSKNDKILTGSFDKTAKIWDVSTSQCLQTYKGHTDEVISAQFLPNEDAVVTASIDTTLRIFHLESAQEIAKCAEHNEDIVCLEIDKNGKFLVSGSFDKTIRIWDPRNGSCIHTLCGHEAEISNCKMNNEGSMLVSGSFDGRIIVWDLRQMKYFKIFPTDLNHQEKILDVDINSLQVAGCTAKGRAYIFNISTDNSLELFGHADTIFKICFNPINEYELMTCSSDRTVRIWNIDKPQIQSFTLQHPDEVFSVVYTNSGNRIISACQDNSCRVWNK